MSSQYYNFYRHGRVGLNGLISLTEYNSLSSAIYDFEQKKNHLLISGYREYDFDEYENDEVQDKNIQRKESILPLSIQNLVNDILDSKIILSSLISLCYDYKKLFLKNLQQNSIDIAYITLNEIAKLIEESERLLDIIKQEKFSYQNEFQLSINKVSKTKLDENSNKFYSYIPFNFLFKKISEYTIQTKQQVFEKLQMLQGLQGLKIVENLCQIQDEQESITDLRYKNLNCKINTINQESTKQFILNYINKTALSPINILEMFEMQPNSQDQSKLNEYLLWYGSDISYSAAIIHQGLSTSLKGNSLQELKYQNINYLFDDFEKSRSFCKGNDQESNIFFQLNALYKTKAQQKIFS
ncbi:hypothetical protein ABPG74_001720 [Tetrahymena malaccensis]